MNTRVPAHLDPIGSSRKLQAAEKIAKRRKIEGREEEKLPPESPRKMTLTEQLERLNSYREVYTVESGNGNEAKADEPVNPDGTVSPYLTGVHVRMHNSSWRKQISVITEKFWQPCCKFAGLGKGCDICRPRKRNCDCRKCEDFCREEDENKCTLVFKFPCGKVLHFVQSDK
mmetsp:Transcript_16292/g.21559  ORF Transcript_16292/g.21559 Transcript_16292/m.21559 type:complete len:172 (+) Transcript_16292:162-677(+)